MKKDKLKKLKMPSADKAISDEDIMMDLEGLDEEGMDEDMMMADEGLDEEGAMESPLADFSDDELMEEMKARGLMGDDEPEDDMEYAEEDDEEEDEDGMLA